MNRPVKMRQHLDMHRDHGSARVGEGLDVAIRLHDHEVNVERKLRHVANRPHDRRSDSDVRDEMAVHHVDVNQIGASALGGCDRLAERGEVCRKNRRCQLDQLDLLRT